MSQALHELARRLSSHPSPEAEALFVVGLSRELRRRASAWEQREQLARGLLGLLAEVFGHPQAALSLRGPEGRYDLLDAPGGLSREQLAQWRARLQLGDAPLQFLSIAEQTLPLGEVGEFPVELTSALLGRLWVCFPPEQRWFDAARLFAEECAPFVAASFLREEARRLARIDPVTGLLTRRSFAERLEVEFERVQRYGGALAVMRCDLDWPSGPRPSTRDALLVGAARALEQELRRSDTLSRSGEEEFALLLPSTPEAGARLVAERLRKRIRLPAEGGRDPITMSIGAALYAEDRSAASLLDRADRALYRARRRGPNQIEFEPRD